MIHSDLVSGFILGCATGVAVGLWYVYWWGLRGKRPQWTRKALLLWLDRVLFRCCVGAVALLASTWFGVGRDWWLAVAAGFPLGVLPLLSVAASAHSYVLQSLAVAGICLYIGVVHGLAGDVATLSWQFSTAAVFIVLPIVFAVAGNLHHVQAWNYYFWRKIRMLFGMPARPGDS
jgi:hypothetical protein